MSKMYLLKRMSQSPAAGGLLTGIINVGKKLLGIGKTVATQVAPTLKSVAPTAAVVAAGTLAGSLLEGSGGGGASGGWTGRRRAKGITARELRGYRKVANLLHKEGMVSKRARGKH